jgi:hypothetical protein
MTRKLVKVPLDLYEEACTICEHEGRTLGDALAYVQLRRREKREQEANPTPAKPEPKRIFIKYPSGTRIAVKEA